MNDKKALKKFCSWPFSNVWIRSDGDVSICCRMKNGGIVTDARNNLNNADFKEIINSDIARDMRRSILDGSYEYCSPDCPKLYERHDLNKEKTLKKLVDSQVVTVDDVNDSMHIVLGYDLSCPLVCPSCRKKLVYAQGEELEQLRKYHNNVLEKIPAPKELNVAGSGDALGSPVIRGFLENFDQYPKFANSEIYLATNGILLTPKTMESIAPCHKNIKEIMISIDGATEKTYKKTRTGSFKTIKRNMDYLATYKKAKGFRVLVNFIVQQNNYEEMGDMVDLCRSWKVDKLSFVPIRYWESGSYSKDEMQQQRVFEPPHPLFARFRNILKDNRLDDPVVDLQGELSFPRRD